MQSYEGRRDLTFWHGKVLSLGFGQGEDVVMNSHYQTVARVPGGNGLQADLHDFQIAPHDISYTTAFNAIRCNLSSVDGASDGVILDTAVQEIDMKTGLVRWEWHSVDHVGASESETPAPKSAAPWDWFHINSIDAGARREHLHLGAQHLGRLSVGRRQRQHPLAPGRPEELLQDGPGYRNRMAARRAHPPGWRSHLLRRRLEPAHPPTVARPADRARLQDTRSAPDRGIHAPRSRPCSPQARATCRRWPTATRWWAMAGCRRSASLPREAQLLFDAHLPFDMSFYRAFRFPWSGRPSTPPTVLANLNNTGEETIVHMSWNGASEVASWRVLAGERPGSLTATDHDPGERLRKLDDPAQEVRLRGSTGAGRDRQGARQLEARQGQHVRRRTTFHPAVGMSRML